MIFNHNNYDWFMFINEEKFILALQEFAKEGPFDHCVIDDFFEAGLAKKLEKDFPDYNSSLWQNYNNAIEVKKLKLEFMMLIIFGKNKSAIKLK